MKTRLFGSLFHREAREARRVAQAEAVREPAASNNNLHPAKSRGKVSPTADSESSRSVDPNSLPRTFSNTACKSASSAASSSSETPASAPDMSSESSRKSSP